MDPISVKLYSAQVEASTNCRGNLHEGFQIWGKLNENLKILLPWFALKPRYLNFSDV